MLLTYKKGVFNPCTIARRAVDTPLYFPTPPNRTPETGVGVLALDDELRTL